MLCKQVMFAMVSLRYTDTDWISLADVVSMLLQSPRAFVVETFFFFFLEGKKSMRDVNLIVPIFTPGHARDAAEEFTGALTFCRVLYGIHSPCISP